MRWPALPARTMESVGSLATMSFPCLLLALLPAPSAAAASEARFAAAPGLAAKIDAGVQHHWQEDNSTPAPPCDDATFLRRVTLYLAGRIPTMGEAKAFAAERSPDKRARAIRR